MENKAGNREGEGRSVSGHQQDDQGSNQPSAGQAQDQGREQSPQNQDQGQGQSPQKQDQGQSSQVEDQEQGQSPQDQQPQQPLEGSAVWSVDSESLAESYEGAVPATMEDTQEAPYYPPEEYGEYYEGEYYDYDQYKYDQEQQVWVEAEPEKGTEDADVEMTRKKKLRDLILYILFLVIVSIVTFAMQSNTMYYYTQTMTELFLDAPFPDTKNTFKGLSSMQDLWRFVDGPLIDGLYWDSWYNNHVSTPEQAGYIFYENKLLGVPRIRQVRVKNDSCSVIYEFSDKIFTCYDQYETSTDDEATYGTGNGSAWKYATSNELDGRKHSGFISTYGGGGFYQDLGTSKIETISRLAELKNNRWLDRGTRAVFIDFTTYNSNINLFCVISFLVEFPATGGAIPSWSFRTVKLIRYVTPLDYFVLACECIFIIYIIYYLIRELKEMCRFKCKYFKSFWNIIDVIVISIAVCSIIFNVFRTVKVANILDSLLQNPDKYPNFKTLAAWQFNFNTCLAIMVFLAWIKLFKYISFNRTMIELSETLAECAKELFWFTILFSLLFVAFAQLGFLMFGTVLKDFSSFPSSIFTLFRIILGDFNFHQIEQANRIFGPIFFILYVFFIFFVLLNIFLAIINETYPKIKDMVSTEKHGYEVPLVLRKAVTRVLVKMNVRNPTKADIKRALHLPDKENLDLDMWKMELTRHGYAEAEVEAIIAQYDADGDRCLDRMEIEKFQTAIDEAKAADDLGYEPEGNTPRTTSMGSLETGRTTVSSPSTLSETTIGPIEITKEDFTDLITRVDRIEASIDIIVDRIDGALVTLERMENEKERRKDSMDRILMCISEPDPEKRAQMEEKIRKEFEKANKKKVTLGRLTEEE